MSGNFINRNDIMHRHGFTLIELVAVLGGLVVVMGISMGLLFAMLDFQQRHDEQSMQLRSTNMFFTQFRNDARIASGQPVLSLDATAVSSFLIEWPVETGKIRYRLAPGEFPEKQLVIREVWDAEKITGTETYSLPDHAVIWLTEGKNADAGLIALNLWEHRPHTNPPETAQLDPFTRILNGSPENPNVAACWRTVIVRTPEISTTTTETAEQGE
ncbi:MAG: hypothetical protein FWC50_16250 [Planctomycetaceae bacterium]|nr:hypothetical protein [Planctomycetaceae bacterium]